MMKKITRECVGEYCRGWGGGRPQEPVKVGEVCPMPSFLGLSRLWVNVPSPLKKKNRCYVSDLDCQSTVALYRVDLFLTTGDSILLMNSDVLSCSSTTRRFIAS